MFKYSYKKIYIDQFQSELNKQNLLLYIKILISFINLIKKTYKASLFIIFNKSIIKKRNRIDNIEDSYKMFVFTYNYLNLFLINLIIII